MTGIFTFGGAAGRSVPADEAITGLDLDGTAGGTGPLYANGTLKRGFYVPAGTANGLPMTPVTMLMQMLTRSQVGTVQRFHCGVFWGNHGDFETFTNYGRAYWGFHGYPRPDDTGTAKLEALAGGIDFGTATDDVTREDSSSPNLTLDVFKKYGLVTNHIGSGPWTRKLYCDLPSVSDANRIENERDNTASDVTPPDPVLMFGQTGSRVTTPLYDSASWGNQIRWEELNGILRAIQVYSASLSEAHVVALSALETNAEVLDYCSAQSITSLWYLCMNPTPEDDGINDHSGNNNHGIWDGADRPDLYEAA